jgi:hypothetical protein
MKNVTPDRCGIVDGPGRNQRKSRGDVHDDAVMPIVTTLAAGIDPQDAWSGCAETATS